MTRFADRTAAGVELAAVLRERGPWPDAVVVAIDPTGGPVADAVAVDLGVQRLSLTGERIGDGPELGAIPRIRGRIAIVVDAGVETGAMAHVVGAALRAKEPALLVLAVPVCPQDALTTLELVYDTVVCVEVPHTRRSMRWHYESLA